MSKENQGKIIADMHTHSEHSHDSRCPISDMAKKQIENGTSIFAVTDHCDIGYYETLDIKKLIGDSVSDAKKNNAEIDGVEILAGLEIGETFWHKEIAEKLLSDNSYDVVIGSVHAVQYEGYTMPYSQIDFAMLGRKTTCEYLDKYFDDVSELIESTDFDILAHLTCPLRYINGKYGLNIDCKIYNDKIEDILKAVIKRNLVLEINTSCRGGNYDEFMPEEWIIKLYKALGGSLVSLGSDAHIKENASYYFSEAVEMLKNNGFNKSCYLKSRKIHQYDL